MERSSLILRPSKISYYVGKETESYYKDQQEEGIKKVDIEGVWSHYGTSFDSKNMLFSVLLRVILLDPH